MRDNRSGKHAEVRACALEQAFGRHVSLGQRERRTGTFDAVDSFNRRASTVTASMSASHYRYGPVRVTKTANFPNTYSSIADPHGPFFARPARLPRARRARGRRSRALPRSATNRSARTRKATMPGLPATYTRTGARTDLHHHSTRACRDRDRTRTRAPRQPR